jgi:hypothetical protein
MVGTTIKAGTGNKAGIASGDTRLDATFGLVYRSRGKPIYQTNTGQNQPNSPGTYLLGRLKTI